MSDDITRLNVQVRRFGSGWAYDLVDDADNSVYETGWQWPSSTEALRAGLQRLAELARTSRGAVAPSRTAVRRTRDHLIIVDPQEPTLYRSLKRLFAGDDRTEVMFDRRMEEQRVQSSPRPFDRRRRERRTDMRRASDRHARWFLACPFDVLGAVLGPSNEQPA